MVSILLKKEQPKKSHPVQLLSFGANFFLVPVHFLFCVLCSFVCFLLLCQLSSPLHMYSLVDRDRVYTQILGLILFHVFCFQNFYLKFLGDFPALNCSILWHTGKFSLLPTMAVWVREFPQTRKVQTHISCLLRIKFFILLLDTFQYLKTAGFYLLV